MPLSEVFYVDCAEQNLPGQHSANVEVSPFVPDAGNDIDRCDAQPECLHEQYSLSASEK